VWEKVCASERKMEGTTNFISDHSKTIVIVAFAHQSNDPTKIYFTETCK
jgi:TolB-like protein